MQQQFVRSMVLVAALGLATSAQAQGVVGGAAHGSAVGNQAAGPVGAVVGGVVGGVLGGVGAVLGVDYHPAYVEEPVLAPPAYRYRSHYRHVSARHYHSRHRAIG
jgi:hypothetical protein